MIQPLPPPSGSNRPGPQINSSDNSATKTGNKLITTDPAAFTKRLKEIGNSNEVLIAVKTANASRVSKNFIKELPVANDAVIALSEASGAAPQRTSPGFAKVNAQSRQAIRVVLNAQNVAQFRAPDFGNIISTTLPENGTKGIVTALLNNPNVDYIEANQRYPVQFDSNILSRFSSALLMADPQGSNPSDIKHTYHNVLDAWDFTRGSGARVGILDSGFAFDQGTNSYHHDGQLLSSSRGIEKLGFVNDYFTYENCDDGNGQAYGNCLPWDDDSHGTSMSGLVGANDNDLNYVGIMPDGLTVSMKIARNCEVSANCFDSDTFFIESDDFEWAVNYARNNDIDILSMSFSSTSIGFSVYNALYNAYHQDDILLLSSTGNDGSSSDLDKPQRYNFVMGVGGLDFNGNSIHKEDYEEISALSGGGTLATYCPPQSFCEPNGNRTSGGTSASTAISAGIAGLVRTYNPSLSASQTRNRLINTSTGINNRVDAYVAVTNDYPLSVYINGPAYIGSSGNYSWEAMPEHGEAGYSYQWEYRETFSDPWQTVGSSKTYNRFVSTNGQNFQLQVTVTSGSEQETAVQLVTVSSEDCPPGQICA